MPQKSFFPKFIKIIFLAFIIALVFYFLPGNIAKATRQVLYTVFSPFQKIFYLSGNYFGDQADFLKSIGSLKEENKKLLKENNNLAREVASLREQKSENEILRQELGLIPRKKFDLEASFVIGQNPEKSSSWILIDKGSADGLKTGMPVIVSDGILVGKIDEVYWNSAKVNLLSDPSVVVNAVDLESGARGIVKGEYGLGMTLSLVEQTETINDGDILVTSGLGGDLPQGLLIGKIQNIKVSSDKLFQEASVLPRIKYSKLNVVFVIKN